MRESKLILLPWRDIQSARCTRWGAVLHNFHSRRRTNGVVTSHLPRVRIALRGVLTSGMLSRAHLPLLASRYHVGLRPAQNEVDKSQPGLEKKADCISRFCIGNNGFSYSVQAFLRKSSTGYPSSLTSRVFISIVTSRPLHPVITRLRSQAVAGIFASRCCQCISHLCPIGEG